MKSPQQKRKEITQKRSDKRAAEAAIQLRKTAEREAKRLEGKVLVNESALAPSNSYSIAEFVERGYYEDIVFNCKDCRKTEVWTGTQQKWWYEVARGDRFTTAIRCRNCRRKERERRAAVRADSEAGILRKKNRKSS